MITPWPLMSTLSTLLLGHGLCEVWISPVSFPSFPCCLKAGLFRTCGRELVCGQLCVAFCILNQKSPASRKLETRQRFCFSGSIKNSQSALAIWSRWGSQRAELPYWDRGLSRSTALTEADHHSCWPQPGHICIVTFISFNLHINSACASFFYFTIRTRTGEVKKMPKVVQLEVGGPGN